MINSVEDSNKNVNYKIETEEYLDICDNNGIPSLNVVSRKKAHNEGIMHRTAHVWIVRKQNEKYQVLLQKRASNKDSFPGRYDTSSAGHIKSKDAPIISAVRELREELGISASIDDLSYVGIFRVNYDKEFHGKMFRDREVAFVYIYKEIVDMNQLKLQKEEVEEVSWFDIEYVYKECMKHNNIFCVPTKGLKLIIDSLKIKI